MTPAPKHILVADDQHIVTTLLTGILSKLGFTDVAVVHDGEAALERLRAERFDALITDIRMGPMGGLHLVAAIRKDERLADLPVIVMTGSSEPSLFVAAKTLRANAVLAKPFSPQTLREHLDRLLPRGV